MNTYPGKTITFTHDEIGTIAVRKIQRACELGDKRKRKSEVKQLAHLLPDPQARDSDWIYDLRAVSLGVDVNGELIVVATYSMSSLKDRLAAYGVAKALQERTEHREYADIQQAAQEQEYLDESR